MRALSFRGFEQVTDLDAADVVLFLAYDIGEPQIEVPQLGAVGTGTYHTTFNAATGSATTTERKTLGVTGYRTKTRKTVTFSRYLYLSAIDLRAYRQSGEMVEAWRTVVISEGTSNDLRRVFPVMMAAAMRRLANNTQGKPELVRYAFAPARPRERLHRPSTAHGRSMRSPAHAVTAVEASRVRPMSRWACSRAGRPGFSGKGVMGDGCRG